MSEFPSASIIVLNWNGRSYLEACLNALLNQTINPEQIILVDNGSTDDSVALVLRQFPTVEILENEINLGYAGGNNSALRRSHSDVAILVNPDIVVNENWLEQILLPFEQDAAIGLAGCKLLFPGGQQLQHAGGVITHPRAMPGHRGMYTRDEGQVDSLADVDFVTGAAIAVRRETLETSGLLDEGFFMYFEDADWCTRALRNGYRVVYVPQATAVHDESAIAVRGSPSYLRYFHTGRWRYLLKHFDADEIVEKSLPAEAAWLAGIEGDERRALGWAYRDTVANFPAIMAARLAHGAAKIPESDQTTITTGLLAMRQAAMLWPDDPAIWTELTRTAQVKAEPFSSTAPVLGPLFARLRDLWAGVSAKAYIGTLNVQQNEFNQSAVDELQEIESRLIDFTDVWMNREEQQRKLTWQISALQREIDETYSLLESIESRLADRAATK